MSQRDESSKPGTQCRGGITANSVRPERTLHAGETFCYHPGMPQSLSRILLHLVFATKNREPWLDSDRRPRVFAYLAEIGRDMDCTVYRVGGVADHIHMAIELPRTMTVADFVKKVKAASSVWIKDRGSNHAGFSWQAGYGVFSLGASQLQSLTDYIDRQEEHHRVKGFQEEYLDFLKKYRVAYDERYLWE